MTLILLYLVVLILVAVVLFGLASVIFGRGERLPPLPHGTTATMLPASGVTGSDVDAITFSQALRGYRTSEVDWVLGRLGQELDLVRGELAAVRAAHGVGSDGLDDGSGEGPVDDSGDDSGDDCARETPDEPDAYDNPDEADDLDVGADACSEPRLQGAHAQSDEGAEDR